MKPINWYVAYTYPKYEKKVEASIQDLGFEVFLPLHKVKRRWSDRIKEIEVPLFSNYLFVYTDEDHIPRLTEVDGIARFISFQKKFATIKDQEIALIRNALREDRELQIEPNQFHNGQKVRIEDGPFMGVQGILTKKWGKKRFIVEIEGLNRHISLNLPSYQLAIRN
jgi:transcription antitermination factor NusG